MNCKENHKNIDRAGVLIYEKKDRKGRILLVKGSEKKKWGFPKGQIMEGESIMGAAMRETEEETGILVRLTKKHTFFTRFKCRLYICSTGDIIRKGESSNEGEICEKKWFSREEINLFKRVDVNRYLWVWINEKWY